MNRKRIILAVLLGVLGGCMIYAYFAMPRLEKAPPRTERQSTRPLSVDQGQKQETSPEIDFDDIFAGPEEYVDASRDIFRYVKQRKAQPRAAQPVVEAPAARVDLPSEQPSVVPMADVQKSLSRFTFLGFLEKAGEKTVFLSSSGELFLVKRGESFGAEDEFLVVAIDGNLLQVSHTGRDNLIKVPLIEQQALNASASSPAHSTTTVPRAQPGAQMTAPHRRFIPLPAKPESDEESEEINDEINLEEEQESDAPVNEDVLEGETNGSNQ